MSLIAVLRVNSHTLISKETKAFYPILIIQKYGWIFSQTSQENSRGKGFRFYGVLRILCQIVQSDTSHVFNCVYWKRKKFLNFVSFWFKENSTVLTVYFNHCLNFRKYDARGKNTEGKWKRNITEIFILWLITQNFGNFSNFCKFCIFNTYCYCCPRHL